MWFSVQIEEGDLSHKIKKVKEFLAKKHPVKLTIRSRGRVKRGAMEEMMKHVLEELGDSIVIEDNAKYEGRNFISIVKPVKTSHKENN